MAAKRRRSAKQQQRSRRGMILVIVFVVIMFLALGAYSFTDLMLTHHESAQLTGMQVQTRQLVDSGRDLTRFFLSKPPATRLQAGGVFNNPDQFKGITIVPDDDPKKRGSVCILSPNLNDDGNLAGLRYGLEDESTRLNLNTLLVLEAQQEGAAVQLLMSLPRMTEEVANAILDWLDPDDEPRPLGAEVDYYSGLTPPYRPKNGPLDSVEELLLVRGITPELLIGADVNRNGTLDPQEGGGTGATTSASDRGWGAYFTLHSLESNLQENGQPRVYLNGNDMQLLSDSLLAADFPQDWVNFIIAYRQNGPNAAAGQASSPASNLPAPDLTKAARIPLTQLLDLCDARLRITNNGTTMVIQSPFNSGLAGGMPVWLPKLMDTCTINPAVTIPGRININQAPAHILRGIPGMTDDIVTEILSRREYEPAADNANKRHETWIMAEGIVTLEEMRTLMPFVCAGGDVYRAQIVGYYQSGEASSRVEAIFDASVAPTRVLFWRDLSHYGRGYAVETLGVDFLEGGTTPTVPGGLQ
ncbi:type II secretion system minor pseudopilin [Anatilimnocola floriformis]|uniref:general secretion pathway protein GspK n=1 Tax=Anatilimnocola floriformis TaxID=2948575 RepID=UPI0020C2D0F0|nr:type II secretion system protein GspK [Anatilimnocola floriformis]